MFLIDKISLSIGRKATETLNLNEDNQKIIVYGATNLLQMTWAIIWVCILGFIFGVFYEAIIFSFAVSILRKYSGGAHASSPNRCVFIGTFVATTIGILVDKSLCKVNMSTVVLLSTVCIIFAFIVVIKNAPVDSIKKPIKGIELRQRFKFYSTIVILIYLIIMIFLMLFYTSTSNLFYLKVVECISISVLWQAITLTKGGISILNKVDFVLKYII